MLRTILSGLLLLISLPALAANSCPGVKDIKRTSGEFSWTSQVPSWTGHYAFPLRAKGNSTEVTYFIEARWIQLTNLTESQGYFECDYQGNYDGEIIRFVQSGTHAGPKPTDTHWSCNLNPNFPSPQCVCSAGSELCVLETVDNSPPPQPMYINPAATNTGESFPSTEYLDK